MQPITIVFSLVFLIIGAIVGYLFKKFSLSRKEKQITGSIKGLIEEKRNEAEKIVLEAKDRALKILDQAKNEEKERLDNVRKEEVRLRSWEQKLHNREEKIEKVKEAIQAKAEDLRSLRESLEEIKKEEEEKLRSIAGLSKEEARKILFETINRDYEKEIKELVTRLEKNKKEILEKKGTEIMLEAMQRYAPSKIEEYTTATVELPDDETKGKIIGKEGRNIKTFQRITGVDVLIDETPNVVVISSFSPLRREIGKETLTRLIKDGRIQPARIEEIYQKVKEEFSERIQMLGEESCAELGINDFPSKLIYLVGMLHFRTSYGQNLLRHSVEVAHLSKLLAQELNVDKDVCCRAGLLHDIGKVLSHDIEGSHVEIGKRILEKFELDDRIVRAVLFHHEIGVEAPLEAKIIQVADAISSSRPGARKESYEAYIKRIESLEKTINSFEGVESSYVISGGREVRVFINPKLISDLEAMNLAKKIAKKIEEEITYPGEIKVNVIRETRVIEYAR